MTDGVLPTFRLINTQRGKTTSGKTTSGCGKIFRVFLLLTYLSTFLLWTAQLYVSRALAEDRFITLASTTSPDHSGLYDYLLPQFTKQTGICVRVIAVGTGQAFEIARRGDADVVIVHYPPAEKEFIANGYGMVRYDLMKNTFILVGPPQDNADVKNATSILDAFFRIAEHKATFLSRGDDSGTHAREKELWRKIGGLPNSRRDSWYLESGSGMGSTLRTAQDLGAYTLSDKATWKAYQGKSTMITLWEGGDLLKNPYSVVTLNPTHFAHLKKDMADSFTQWLISSQGQKAIASFTIDGEAVFAPAYRP